MRDRGPRRIDFRVSLASCCALLCLASSGCTHPGDVGPACPPPAAATALTNEQRKAFLHYYSPVILKQAQEPSGFDGRDWITNFHFDADGQFSNNKKNWELKLWGFVKLGRHSSWQIRPTLYSHIIEFTENGKKSVVLVYHVYHAMQIDSIHDWERVELRLDGVEGGPGSGESIAFVVITEHSWHRARPASDVSFQETPKGKHVLIWQAPWGVTLQPGKSVGSALPMTAQLNFVEEDWETLQGMIQGNCWATLGLTNDITILEHRGTPGGGGSLASAGPSPRGQAHRLRVAGHGRHPSLPPRLRRNSERRDAFPSVAVSLLRILRRPRQPQLDLPARPNPARPPAQGRERRDPGPGGRAHLSRPIDRRLAPEDEEGEAQGLPAQALVLGRLPL
jgi:hypothetical protein